MNFTSRLQTLLLFTVWLMVCSLSVAQNNNNTDTRISTAQDVNHQQDLSRTLKSGLNDQQLVPEIAPGEMEDTGPQVIVKRKVHRKLFEVNIDAEHYYTSNVFLQKDLPGNGPIDTSLQVSTVDIAYAPDAYDVGWGKLSPRIGHRYQWYNYSLESNHPNMNGISMNNYDFDAETLYANLDTKLESEIFGTDVFKDVVFSTGYQWQRLMGHEPPQNDYYEFYREHTPTWGVSRDFPLQEKILLSLSYGGAYRWTEADPPDRERNDRLDESFTISYMQELYPRLTMQIYGQYLFSLYSKYKNLATDMDSHRQDDTYSTGLTFQYTFNDWASVRSFISYDHRETTTPNLVDRYDNFNGGVGGSLVFRF